MTFQKLFTPFESPTRALKNSAPTPQAILPPVAIHLEAWGQA